MEIFLLVHWLILDLLKLILHPLELLCIHEGHVYTYTNVVMLEFFICILIKNKIKLEFVVFRIYDVFR